MPETDDFDRRAIDTLAGDATRGGESASPSSDAEHETAPALTVPRDTTPTWELEMLVSGAVIFGLFQLPPLLNRGFDVMVPRFAGGTQRLLFVGLTLSEAAVFALLTAFLVHLVSRTYWVALVGLDSVYPHGVRWERLGRGPMLTEILRARHRSLSERIAAVDNFCSVIFGFAFLAAMMVGFSAVLLALATALALLISRAFFGGRNTGEMPTLIALLFVFTIVALNRLDRRFGARLAADGWRARALRAALGFFHRISGQSLFGPIFNTLMSNVRRRFMLPMLMGVVALSVAAVAFQRTIARGGAGLSSYTYAAVAARDETVDFRSYGDQRAGEAVHSPVPFIQSDMIRDPYVRLFIPYLPDRDNPALERCPGAAPAPDRTPSAVSDRAAATLRCLAALHAVQLDGRPLPDLDFRFYTDPASGLLGILTYIPVAGLPRGRNVLSLESSPPPSDSARSGPATRTTIPFWI